MDKIIVTIWLVTAAIIFGGCVFWLGYDKAKRKLKDPYARDDTGDVIPAFVGFAFFWPLIVLLSPFFGLYYLGKYLGVKIAANKYF